MDEQRVTCCHVTSHPTGQQPKTSTCYTLASRHQKLGAASSGASTFGVCLRPPLGCQPGPCQRLHTDQIHTQASSMVGGRVQLLLGCPTEDLVLSCFLAGGLPQLSMPSRRQAASLWGQPERVDEEKATFSVASFQEWHLSVRSSLYPRGGDHTGHGDPESGVMEGHNLPPTALSLLLQQLPGLQTSQYWGHFQSREDHPRHYEPALENTDQGIMVHRFHGQGSAVPKGGTAFVSGAAPKGTHSAGTRSGVTANSSEESHQHGAERKRQHWKSTYCMIPFK